MSDILGIGLTGLNAAQAQLVTTGHNISNASTPGYSRQQVLLQPNTPQFTGSGFLGNGVQVETVRRAYDDFLTSQVQQTQAQSSQSAQYYTQMQQLDNMLGTANSGLSPALQNFFSGVQTVANDPSSVSSRQALLSNAQAMISTFQDLSQQMTQFGKGVNTQITASVTAINSYAQRLAQLNDSIVAAQGVGGANPPNDLMDQRDQVMLQLNQEVQATAVKQTDGSYSIFIGNGIPLVVGNQTFALTSMNSPTDPGQVEVGYGQPGNQVALGTNSIIGGNLGGVLQFRDNSLTPAQDALGRVAIGLASTFNAQNNLGQDLNGAIGGDIFNVPAPVVDTSSLNTGTGVVAAAITNVGALTTSDYTLSYDGANYHLTRQSDNNVTTFAGFPQTVDGVTLSLSSGVIKAGDTFLISPTATGASGLSLATTDVSKIAAAAPILGSAGFANTGSATISAGVVNGPPPVNANLKQPVTITFTGPGTFNVTGVGTLNPVGVAYASGGNISYNGWTVQITGTPAVGDTFTVTPNTNGNADNRNALLLAGLQTQNTLAGGSTTYQGAYGQLVSDVGNKTSELQVTSQAQQTLLTQTQTSQQSISGVNLDEEAANLIRYQQAYQACGKMIQVANTCFQTIINIGA